MRVIVQRVSGAKVEVEGKTTGSIDAGLLVLVGIKTSDNEKHASYMARKVWTMRIFSDEQGRMNRSVSDAGGSILTVPQFTLYGDTKKGSRPSFDQAAKPEMARELYNRFVSELQMLGAKVQTGVFQAHMLVHLTNEGPVTLICEI